MLIIDIENHITKSKVDIFNHPQKSGKLEILYSDYMETFKLTGKTIEGETRHTLTFSRRQMIKLIRELLSHI